MQAHKGQKRGTMLTVEKHEEIGEKATYSALGPKRNSRRQKKRTAK
jgi:hypothetical protein